MKARITAIGNEILIGQVLDTNSHWLAAILTSIGFEIERITAIADTKEAIWEALSAAEGSVDLICFTGGLGPTSDDITLKVFADYFDSTLVLDPAVLADIKAFFSRRGRHTITQLNHSQAMVLSHGEVIRNMVGTAPGSWLTRSGTVFVSMPGVPHEMKQMMTDTVLPKLKTSFELPVICQKTVLTFGIPESDLADRIADWEASLGDISLAYLPSPSGVRLRLTCFGDHRDTLLKKIEEKISALQQLIPDAIFGFDDQSLASVVGEAAMGKGVTLATAESCTGGEIARQITSVPGASRYYVGSVISYANEVKLDALGVSKSDLERDGAVSQSVVEAMAQGVRRQLGADVAVSVSGIAGPDGGTPDKPVGTVWLAVATPKQVISKRFQFGERRDVNIAKSAACALNMLRMELLKDLGKPYDR